MEYPKVPQLAEMEKLLETLSPEQLAQRITAGLPGFDFLVGLSYLYASPTRVAATLEASEQHVQPYGLVHGGVYCSMAESVCSLGAALWALPKGLKVLGVENHCRFLRGVRAGESLAVEARPKEEQKGQRLVWRASITDGRGRICAQGLVTIAVLEKGREVAGQELKLQVEEFDNR
jgi:1,4-dihydroxy-2-naphthoyl-CoA hydrolase